MGTSSSRRVPRSDRWQPARDLLGNTRWPVDTQSMELWRAISADVSERVSGQLRSSIVATAAELASTETSPANALVRLSKEIVRQRQAGLVSEMAKRALTRAVAANAGPSGFAAELMAEVVSHYASRELPSLIASQGRVSDTGEVIALKNHLRNLARSATAGINLTERRRRDWSGVVNELLATLTTRRR